MASASISADAAAGGSAEAFEALYQCYKAWVHRLAWRLTLDDELALDILQETFIYLFKKLPTLTLTAKLTTFLYPVVRHLALNALRDRKPFLNPHDTLDEIPAAPVSSQAQDLEDLHAVVSRLPREQRQVVLMRFVDDMTLREIALALDVPEGTVKSRLFHALQTLRRDHRCRSYFLE